jgi:hypothetical protein
VLLQGEATALLQLIDDDADRPNATADEATPDGANAAPVVDGRLVTVATASAELPELQAFDAAVGAAIDESCAA